MTISERIRDAGWAYAPEMDRGGAPVYGWYDGPDHVDYGTREDVARSIGATEAEVAHKERRLDREAERCYDPSLPALPIR